MQTYMYVHYFIIRLRFTNINWLVKCTPLVEISKMLLKLAYLNKVRIFVYLCMYVHIITTKTAEKSLSWSIRFANDVITTKPTLKRCVERYASAWHAKNNLLILFRL